MATRNPTSGAEYSLARSVSLPNQCLLWGRAGGRCEFSGCNKPLWKSSVTHEPVNIAQKAHIYAFSERGPRGNKGFDKALLNTTENLMLVCHECHTKIDAKQAPDRYTAALLQQMKHDHERRTETATEVAPDKKTRMLLYGANIGVQSASLSVVQTARALFPYRYASLQEAIQLGMKNNASTDHDGRFFEQEAKNLAKLFQRKVGELLADGQAEHISVFALAPQPLLVQLGTLLGDIVECDVFQRHREPPGWEWPEVEDFEPFELIEPSDYRGIPALILSLSGTVVPERVTRVLGREVSIWTIRVAMPHNDLIKSKQQLSKLRTLLRTSFDRIKAEHGQDAVLHIFPAAPVSACVEMGRVRMPKADMPWTIYDHNNSEGGFQRALTISQEALWTNSQQ